MIELIPKWSLMLQATLSLSLTLILSFLHIPILFLQGLNTYIHPDDISSNTNVTSTKPKRKKNLKFEFDENKAQIYRLKLTDAHLQTRPFFKEFYGLLNGFLVCMASMLLQFYLSMLQTNQNHENNEVLNSGAIVPVLLAFVSFSRMLFLMCKVSYEKSASRKSDKQLSFVLGLLGFVLGMGIVVKMVSFFDFEFANLDGFGKFLVALCMGIFTGFLFMPSARNARVFWLGTDQIRCNLSIIYCGWIGRMLLYVNYLMIVFTSLLWIKPFSELLVSVKGDKMVSDVDELVGNLGMERSDFVKFRLWCLLLSGLIQIFTLRPNLQMYLNEAVLSWYQRLHASKVPDMEFSRAKVFLHNHYLCLTVVQFFVPAAMVLLFLGVSQIDDDLVKGFVKQMALAKQVALLMAWWINFVWAVLTFATLVLFRRGAMYVS